MIKGIVHKGKGIARERGFPTANIMGSLSVGVYTGESGYGGCLIFVANPPEIEIHIIGFNRDIYGETIEVKNIKKIPKILTDICYTLNRGVI